MVAGTVLRLPLGRLVEHQLKEGFGDFVGEEVAFRVGPVHGGRSEEVEGEFEGTIDHARYDPFQGGGGSLKARVGVDFDEPGLEVLVDHEIEPEYFEGRKSVPVPKLGVGGFDGVEGNLFELGTDISCEAVLAFAGLVQILLELLVAEFVAVLVLAILIGVDLDGVVGEVDALVDRVLELVLVATGPDISFFVPVSFEASVLNRAGSTRRTSSI